MDTCYFIWDLDGTLIDSYPHTLDALEETYQTFQLAFDRQRVSHKILTESIGTLITELVEHQEVERLAFEKELKKRRDLREDLIEPLPGAEQTLAALQQVGHQHFIYTHKDGATHPLLERLGWTVYFTEVITSEAGFRRKPDPQAIHYLAERYHLNLATTYYVGDRELDRLCAVAAGIRSVNFLPVQGAEERQMTSLLDLIAWFGGKF